MASAGHFVRLPYQTQGACRGFYGAADIDFEQNISTTTGSKDMQTVSLTLRVLSRPDISVLSKIYQRLGLDYDERILPSIGNEVLKSIVAQFDAAELITQRELVRVFWCLACEGI